jgi:glycyl-tRNA synthetase
MAPYKVAILSLIRKDELTSVTKKIETKLKDKNILSRVDNGSSSIGKRYARCDELGIPYAITVDFDTLNDNSVTLRNLRDTK